MELFSVVNAHIRLICFLDEDDLPKERFTSYFTVMSLTVCAESRWTLDTLWGGRWGWGAGIGDGCLLDNIHFLNICFNGLLSSRLTL